MFHGVSLRLLHNPPLEQITRYFARLQQDGCDAVAIIPHHYVSLEPGSPKLAPPPLEWGDSFIYPDRGQDPTHPYHNTPEPELVLAACQAAARQGLRVLLKPHIDSYAADWRGFISVQDRAADFVWSYRQQFLTRYLEIARQVDDAILCLGCELYTVTKELGAEFWIGLAAWVRQQGYKGPLTYAANWGWAEDAEYNRLRDLWPHLDYIGVDAYFPLVPPGYSGALDVNTLAAAWHRRGIDAGWCPRIDTDLLTLSRQTERPLLFTEIGYPNHSLAAENPGRNPLPTDVRDDDLQRRLVLAYQQGWAGEATLIGTFWWEAGLDQAAKPAISHDILGQPAEQIVFRPPTPHTGVAPPLTLVPPSSDPARALAIHGLHGPNSRLADFHSTPDGPAEGAGAVWQRAQLAGARWLKLLSPDHTRTDAAAAQANGLRVLVRAPGGGVVHWEDVQRMITDFAGVCDVIEVGNEPFPGVDPYATWSDLLWNHAWYLQQVWEHCAAAAHQAHILLCAPGWRHPLDPPVAGTRLPGVPEQNIADLVLDEGLAGKLCQVYGAYDALAYHCYDAVDLNIDPVFDRLARWQHAFGKPIYVTEYGIAFRHLPGVAPEASDLLKAQRYARFVQRLATLDAVQAAFLFILGGTNDFAAFTGGGYDPNGQNSYWISKEAYAALGQALAGGPGLIGAQGLAALAAPPAHIGWADRPHGPDFPVMSNPTISPALFTAWLQARHSPALAESDALAYYRAVLNRGINPALALAFFQHESQCGTDPAGVVVRYQTRNWGNLRPRSNGSLGRAIGTTPQTEWGVFRVYRSYLDGLLDWCDLWFLPLYQGKSVRQALQLYAPSSDGNAPNSYTNIVIRLLTQWDNASGEFDLPGPSPVPPADYALLGPTSITPERFRDTLVKAGSPVLNEADSLDYYQLCTANGVDPAVALAFFGQETGYGTQPGADGNKNWANLWDAAPHRTAIFPAWLAGLRAMCARWQTTPYTDGGPPTIRRIVPLHRGVRNDTDLYIQQVCARIAALRAPAPPPDAAHLIATLDAALVALSTEAAPGISVNGHPPRQGRRALAGAAPTTTDSGRSPLARWVGTWNKTLQHSVNFDVGRNGHQPIAIVNHVMIGTLDGTIGAFSDPATRASAHYGIGQQGQIVQFVNEHDTAWGNGILYDPNVGVVPWLVGVRDHAGDPNNYTISIEYEGTHKGLWIDWQGQPQATLQHGSVTQWWVPTEAQYQAGLALIRDLCARYNIALGGDEATLRAHICRHSDFDNGKKWFCPGEGFPMPRLLTDLRGDGAPDIPLLGPASIPWERFRDELATASSPALAEADSIDYYGVCTAAGVDPAVALAFFGQETGYGTQPGADDNKNWANLWDAAPHRTAVFPTWRSGLQAMCDRWQASPYTADGPSTVRRIVPLHRGVRDDNDLYIQQICARIAALRAPAAAPAAAPTFAALVNLTPAAAPAGPVLAGRY